LPFSTAQEAGVTASLNSVVRNVGQSLGPQVAIAVAVAAPVLAPGVPSEDGFNDAFLLGLLFAIGALVVGWIVPSARNEPFSRRTRPRVRTQAKGTRRPAKPAS
jgi:hypothetical protein